MIWAIILTFIVTSLTGLVMFLYYEIGNRDRENGRISKENDDLRRQINDHYSRDQRRRENRAYDQGLYDGRSTDQLYRQCLKRYNSTKEQVDVMMNGEEGGN